jgi:hypothetical protein
MNVGAQTNCLECRNIVNVGPHLAVEVATAGGTLEGYLHSIVCRAKYEKEHPDLIYRDVV